MYEDRNNCTEPQAFIRNITPPPMSAYSQTDKMINIQGYVGLNRRATRNF
jgi:hypothetical protein